MFKLPDLYYSSKEPVFYFDEIEYTHKYSNNKIITKIEFDVVNLTGDEYSYTPAYCLSIPECDNGIGFAYDEDLKGYTLPDNVRLIKRYNERKK